MSLMAPLEKEVVIPVVDVVANADFETIAVVAPFDGVLKSAAYLADTAITGANTESRTVQVINKGSAGLGSDVMASKAFVSGANAVAFDETALTVDTAKDDFVAGDVIAFKSLHVGTTGLADPGGSIRLVLSRS